MSLTMIMTSTPTRAEVDLPEDLRSTRAARHLVDAALARAGAEALAQDAVLLVSEVVGNALRHGSGTVHLAVECTPSSVHVEVADHSPKLPVRRAVDWESEGGRGTALLDALASAWGVRPRAQGKTVWFELCA